MSVAAFVIKILEPLMTQSSPSGTAVVLLPPASEPAVGSVRPKPQRTFSRQSFGRYFSFCSSFPKW